MKAAGDTYPRMANFSFDISGTRWTVIDSNPYVDWTNAALLEWLRRDLDSARDADWRFVAFHHPGCNSSKAHFDQQEMRLVAPVLDLKQVGSTSFLADTSTTTGGHTR